MYKIASALVKKSIFLGRACISLLCTLDPNRFLRETQESLALKGLQRQIRYFALRIMAKNRQRCEMVAPVRLNPILCSTIRARFGNHASSIHRQSLVSDFPLAGNGHCECHFCTPVDAFWLLAYQQGRMFQWMHVHWDLLHTFMFLWLCAWERRQAFHWVWLYWP